MYSSLSNLNGSNGLNGPASATTPTTRRPHTADNDTNIKNSPFTWPARTNNEPVQPIEVYKKVQRSHSSQNNYDAVSIFQLQFLNRI